MLNPLSTYEEAGRKAAQACNEGDRGRHNFQASWFRKAKSLEAGDDRQAAQDAYDAGWASVRNVPQFTPFR